MRNRFNFLPQHFLVLGLLHIMVSIWLSSCSPVSYLEHHQPSDIIFQKNVYGGVTALVGTELYTPGFTLYADGTVMYYQYVNGRRKLVCARVSRTNFLSLYDWIQKQLALPLERLPQQEDAPVTEFLLDSQTLTIKGLGFIYGSASLDSLQEFSKKIDQLGFKHSRPYVAQKIVLFVKQLSGGESRSWPEWKIREVDLSKVYKKDISFYEPNVTDNSIVLEGKLAKNVQKHVEQTGIYQKFSFNGNIYAVGYKPVLP